MPRTTAKLRDPIILADHAADAETFEFTDIRALQEIVGRSVLSSEVFEITKIAREYILDRRLENAQECASAARTWLVKVRKSASDLREKLNATRDLPFRIGNELDPLLEKKLRDRPWSSRRINGRVSRETISHLMRELTEACQKLEKALPEKADPPKSGSDAFRALVHQSVHWAAQFGIRYSSSRSVKSKFFQIINWITSALPRDVFYKQSDPALAKAITRAYGPAKRGTAVPRQERISPTR